MRDFDKTITSQFYSSPHLTSLISAINAWIDPDADLERFFTLIWNLDSAEGYGLDVWGRIVGVGRVLHVNLDPYFGFAEALDSEGFGQGIFYNGQPSTSNFSLTDIVYRQLIIAKAALNITDSSIPAINSILMNILFPFRGNAYVEDTPNTPGGVYFGFAEAPDSEGFNTATFFSDRSVGPNMQLAYVFDFPLHAYEVAIITQSGVLPKPVGVLANYRYPAII